MKNQLSGMYNFSKENIGHTVILGNVRSGLSIVNAELTKEQLLEREEIYKKHQEKELIKINSIKKCYWQFIANDEDNIELHVIVNSLFANTDLIDDVEPSLDQLEKVFMLFDDYILGQCIAFGVTDTEVSREIDEFIKNNIELISKQFEK